MPHFIIECSENIIKNKPAEQIMQTFFEAAESSGLFNKADIKVRIKPYTDYMLAEGKENFLHVFAHIMQGRTTEQKKALSKKITESLHEFLPGLSVLSINVSDFEAATYYNKAMTG